MFKCVIWNPLKCTKCHNIANYKKWLFFFFVVGKSGVNKLRFPLFHISVWPFNTPYTSTWSTHYETCIEFSPHPNPTQRDYFRGFFKGGGGTGSTPQIWRFFETQLQRIFLSGLLGMNHKNMIWAKFRHRSIDFQSWVQIPIFAK